MTDQLTALRSQELSPFRILAFELFDRLDGEPARDQRQQLAGAADVLLPLLRVIDQNQRLRMVLSAAERDALGKRLDRPVRKDDGRPPDVEKATAASQPTLMRLASGYPRGFVPDLLSVSGCAIDREHMLSGLFVRDRLGRPAHMTVGEALAGSRACVIAARVLVAAHLNGIGDRLPPSENELLVLPLDPAVIGCLDPKEVAEATPNAASIRPAGGGLVPPRKVHHVSPHYPADLSQNRVNGQVALEAIISPAGCVESLRVIQGPHPRLSAEALRAVAAWRYTPALLDGATVPVNMTVTVNFKVR